MAHPGLSLKHLVQNPSQTLDVVHIDHLGGRDCVSSLGLLSGSSTKKLWVDARPHVPSSLWIPACVSCVSGNRYVKLHCSWSTASLLRMHRI